MELKRIKKLAGRASMRGPGFGKMKARVGALEAGARVATDVLFSIGASHRDKAELRKNKAQIEAVLREHAGVLYARIFSQKPNEMGERTPGYIGIQIIGGGSSAQDAMMNAEDIDDGTVCHEFSGRQLCAPSDFWDRTDSGICTAGNPTGQKPRNPGSMSAAPEGLNMGYAANVAKQVNDILEKNPTNSSKSLILHRQSVTRQLFFITKEEWDALK